MHSCTMIETGGTVIIVIFTVYPSGYTVYPSGCTVYYSGYIWFYCLSRWLWLVALFFFITVVVIGCIIYCSTSGHVQLYYDWDLRCSIS